MVVVEATVMVVVMVVAVVEETVMVVELAPEMVVVEELVLRFHAVLELALHHRRCLDLELVVHHHRCRDLELDLCQYQLGLRFQYRNPSRRHILACRPHHSPVRQCWCRRLYQSA
jgi:hypothetical protein